eukprot:GDKJ01027613.1.p1 GENE.GDKJ01027613.1~~GDKJ01027613.1.p1  ORF type:complete len:300 (-),score=41.47 GDKJ01027613.1:31-930(-)
MDKTSGVKHLLKAIAEDNQQEFARLVNEAELNLPDYPTQRTPIFSAAFKGSVYFTSVLINKGAKVNCRDFEGKSPLMEAARCGHDAVVRLMLERGAQINATDNYGRTALFFAVEWKRDVVVRTLMQAGCRLDCITTGRPLKNNPDAMKGLTVSHIAAFIGMPQQSIHLFYAGALKNRFNLGESDEADMIRAKDLEYREQFLAAHGCENPLVTFEKKKMQFEDELARRIERPKDDTPQNEIGNDGDLMDNTEFDRVPHEAFKERPISSGSHDTGVPRDSELHADSPFGSPAERFPNFAED